MVEKWTGGLSILALVFTRLLPTPEWMATMLETDGPLYFFLVIFVLTVFLGLVAAPYALYKEQLDARIESEAKRKPTLNVFLKNSTSSDVLRGATSQALSGSRQTVITNSIPSVLSVTCKNTGETKALNCVARIVSAKQVDAEPDRVLDITESIILPWDQCDPEKSLTKDMPPSDISRIWIASINASGHLWIFRETGKLPVEYQRFFGSAGKYEVIIQIDSDNCPPIQTMIRMISREYEGTGSGVHKGEGEISILSQGSPRLPPPDSTTTDWRR